MAGSPRRQREGGGAADHRRPRQLRTDGDPETGGPHTAHTTYAVPNWSFMDSITACRGKQLRPSGRLADVGPTMLEMMGLPKPAEMDGVSLLRS